jgi:hypothetical protein
MATGETIMKTLKEIIHNLKSNYYILRESIADNRGNIHDSIGYRLAYVRQQIHHQATQNSLQK